ncbi:MAG: thioredoxin family protein [Bacteroidales bacterium]|nr:thioredoxin family protein [Bacteroidales bacterium]
MKKILTILLIVLLSGKIYSQVFQPVSWEYSLEKTSENEAILIFRAVIEKNWHMYGLNIPEGGPVATSVNIEQTADFEKVGELQVITPPEIKYDNTFEMEIELFNSEAVFKQSIKLLTEEPVEVKGYVEYMVCDDQRCLPPEEEEFSIPVTEKALVAETKDTPEKKSDKTLWGIFIIALLGGFGGILTPCVYPMIPLTVSFFMRGEKSRGKAIFNGVFFGLSIIAIYTFVGLIAGITKVDLANAVSTHWLPNVIFFLIFLLLAFSFFGMFEIVLPSGLANKVDQQADKGGLLGPFFMALATAIISFSCTGPIVGVLLGSAMQGEILQPVVGMFGFGLSFSLPFALLAIFPGMMNKLPKSGGWLNAVKVFIAFILLAFSLIFVVNVNETYNLGILNRTTFIAIWIVIFSLLGFYLLGKLKFSHDSELPFITVPRLIFIIITFSFVIYLITGLFGAPLKNISPMLPPAEAVYVAPTASVHTPAEQVSVPSFFQSEELCAAPKYQDFLHLPYGLSGYFDYEQALACAKEKNKPLFIDFIGHTCKNCKQMYAVVWSDPRIQKKLSEDFVVLALYTDDKTKLPESEWITSEIDGKVKKTMGKKNKDFQVSRFNSNALPMYVILDNNGELITEKPYFYDTNVENLANWLEEGKKNF